MNYARKMIKNISFFYEFTISNSYLYTILQFFELSNIPFHQPVIPTQLLRVVLQRYRSKRG